MSEESTSVPALRRIYSKRYAGIIHRYGLCWWFRILKWRRNAKTRSHLADLSVYRYEDIGLTEQQVRDEIRKKFWQ